MPVSITPTSISTVQGKTIDQSNASQDFSQQVEFLTNILEIGQYYILLLIPISEFESRYLIPPGKGNDFLIKDENFISTGLSNN